MQSSSSDIDMDKTKEDQVLYVTPENAATTFLGKPTWCPLSERRLLNKLASFKPFGVRKYVNLTGLLYAMHNIAEDEDDVEFDEYLSVDDYKLYIERQKGQQRDVMIFPPRYRFRPTADEILSKVEEYYSLQTLGQYDGVQITNEPHEYRIPAYIQSAGNPR